MFNLFLLDSLVVGLLFVPSVECLNLADITPHMLTGQAKASVSLFRICCTTEIRLLFSMSTSDFRAKCGQELYDLAASRNKSTET